MVTATRLLIENFAQLGPIHFRVSVVSSSSLSFNIIVILATESGVTCCVGCKASCPLDEFISLTQANIPTDWNAECSALLTSKS